MDSTTTGLIDRRAQTLIGISFPSHSSRGIDAPVSSVTDSVESVIEGNSSKTDENKRYSGALP